MDTRRGKEDYYLDIADAVLNRSTCLRRKYGAIIVRNDEILSTGYNGAPRGRRNCTDVGGCMRETLGIPSGVQNSIIAIANVVVQSSINLYGPMAMAGCGSYSKIEGFGFLPINSFALALATFIGQNLGAKQYDRARRGARFGILCSLMMAEVVGVGINLLAPWLISLFNGDPQVIAFGTLQARTVTLFYFLLAFSHSVAGVMRGAGRAIVPMLVMLVCWCVIRVSYIMLVARASGNIQMVFWAYPITWALSSVAFLIYFLRGDWLHYLERKERAA